MTTEKYENMLKGLCIRLRHNKITPNSAKFIVSSWHLTSEQREKLVKVQNNYNGLHIKQTRQEKTKIVRDKFMRNNRRSVRELGGGWYAFSPSGYANYNRNDELKIQGVENLKRELIEFNMFAITEKFGYIGATAESNLNY